MCPPRNGSITCDFQACDVNIRDRIIPSARNVTLVQVTKNVTRYDLVNKGVMSDAIDVRQIEKESGTNIKLYKVIEAVSLEALRAQRIKGDEIPIYRPAVAKAALERPPQIP